MTRIKNTLSRALRGLAPKYRGRRHLTANAHARAWVGGTHSSCLTYLAAAETPPVGAITISYGRGKLVYICPYVD